MEVSTHRSVRCSARSSRSGQPCKRWAILGGTVCPTHGGRAPQVKDSAAERLAALVDPAITALNGLLAADDERARLGAVKDVLDRNGFKPTDKLDINATVNYSRLSDEELEARIADLEGRTRAVPRASRGTPEARTPR